MTPDNLDAHLRRHVRAAHRAIDDRFRDARRHAEASDLETASSRLADLHTSLVGPDGVLEQARRDAFRRSFGHHSRALPASIRRDDVDYHREIEDVAATAPIHHQDPLGEIRGLLGRAAAELPATHAAHDATRPDLRGAAFALWATRHADGVKAAARRAISDSQMAIHHRTAVFLTRPELRG